METTSGVMSAITSILPIIVVLAILGITNTIKAIVYQGKPETYEAKWLPLVPLALGMFYGIGEFSLGYTKGSLHGFNLVYTVVKQAFGYGGASALLFKLTQPLLARFFTLEGKLADAARTVLLGKPNGGNGGNPPAS